MTEQETTGWKHLVSQDTLNRGETAEQFFRRVAREKPRKPGAPDQRCHWCGEDHRGPSMFWPERERTVHDKALREKGPGSPDLRLWEEGVL
jgi:hypothetical protein